MAAFDSPHQVSLNMHRNEVLILVEAPASVHLNRETCANWRRFQRFLNNQWRCREMNSTIEFSASNRSNYTLEGSSDCSGTHPWMRGSSIAELGTFVIVDEEQIAIRGNG